MVPPSFPGLGPDQPQPYHANAGSYTVIVTATDKDNGTKLRSSPPPSSRSPRPPASRLLIAPGGRIRVPVHEGSAVALKCRQPMAAVAPASATGRLGPGQQRQPTRPPGQTASVDIQGQRCLHGQGLRVTDAAGKTGRRRPRRSPCDQRQPPIARAWPDLTRHDRPGRLPSLSGSATDPSSGRHRCRISSTPGTSVMAPPSSRVRAWGSPAPITYLRERPAPSTRSSSPSTDKDNATKRPPPPPPSPSLTPPDVLALTASAGGSYTGTEARRQEALKATATGGNWRRTPTPGTWTTTEPPTKSQGRTSSSTFIDNGAYTVKASGHRTPLARPRCRTATVNVANVPTGLGGPYSITAGQSLTFKGPGHRSQLYRHCGRSHLHLGVR